MKKIAVFISDKGTGSNLAAIIEAIDKGKIRNGKIVAVVSNKKDALGLNIAKKAGIKIAVKDLSEYKRKGKSRSEYDNDLGEFVKKKFHPDLIVLAGWMLILSGNFIKYFRHRIINLHPGLLPDGDEDFVNLRDGKKIKAIRGLHTDAAVQYAIDHHFPVTGSTVHFITEKVDQGPVIVKSEVRIKADDTVERLYERMKKEEHKILPKAINLFCEGKIGEKHGEDGKMKILIIGSGGRENALAWKFSQSKKVSKIFCAPGNPGTKKIAKNVDISSSDINSLLRFAKKEKIDLTFVGPEAPLVAGITDLFLKNGLKIIGPRKNAAAIEGSKVFAKKLMLKYKIPTGKFAVFDDYKDAKEFLKMQKYPLVIKAEGQCLGKGVAVCKDNVEAQKFLNDVMVRKIFGDEGKRVLVEECLLGQEISFMVVTDGFNFVSLLPSQDHKKINDNDKGPNTGGMGAYAPVSFLPKKLLKRIEKDIVGPTIEAMRKEGCTYEGILYPGLILTDEGPKVLEFNCRFGDPETQPLMMLLKNDLMEICQAIVMKNVKNMKLAWYKGAAVCVVLSSKGYPGKYRKGDLVNGLDCMNMDNHLSLFHSGTKEEKGKILTNSGRVLGVTGKGPDLAKAIKLAYRHIGKNGIYFSGMHYRKDIGLKGLKENLWQ